MTFGALLNAFMHDQKLAIVAFLIGFDIILGVTASVVKPEVAGHFDLAYVGNFLRNDVLGKVLPWFVVYAGDKASHAANLALGIDTGAVAAVAWAAASLALVGSLTKSLSDLGLPLPAPLGRTTRA